MPNSSVSAEHADTPPLFELRGISKEFPGVKALDDVSFEIRAGEVHMLVGENGAGKSSLMKVLCGAYRADQGAFFHDGARVTIDDPTDARKFGIAVIFQEFTLVPYLDIAQNIFLGREIPGKLPGLIDRRGIHQAAQRGARHHRLRYRSAHSGASARRRAAADGRDRQGAVAGRPHPGDGRADRGAVRPRDRTAVRHDRTG